MLDVSEVMAMKRGFRVDGPEVAVGWRRGRQARKSNIGPRVFTL